jgi:hypothetical protein
MNGSRFEVGDSEGRVLRDGFTLSVRHATIRRMTPAGFRRIALGLKGAIEHAHHGHPDFRVGGRIFATLGYPDKKWGMVSLTPEQQREWVRAHPDAFATVNGAWGENGATRVQLSAVDEESLGETLTLAWRNAVAKGPTRAARSRKRAR